MHGVTDAPAVDIYANGSLLVSNLTYGEYQGYLQVPAGDYTIDITAHGSTESVAAFSAPLSGFGGGTGLVYASGFLGSTSSDSVFTLVLATPSGYSVELPSAESDLSIENISLNPKTFYVGQNFPNPFNPITTLRYDLPNDGLVNITIYDMMARKVKTLVNSSQTAGFKSVQWNATNERNEPVSTGLYIYKIQIGDFRQTRKMLLLK